MIMQVHKFEPLSEGSISDFTLWFGPIPIHWVAVHSNVDFPHGFTDTQQQGPMKSWSHTHTFTAESDHVSRVSEHVEYAYRSGWAGLAPFPEGSEVLSARVLAGELPSGATRSTVESGIGTWAGATVAAFARATSTGPVSAN